MVVNVNRDVTLERVRKEVENPCDFYGIGAGLWNGEDAREYVNKLREERM